MVNVQRLGLSAKLAIEILDKQGDLIDQIENEKVWNVDLWRTETFKIYSLLLRIEEEINESDLEKESLLQNQIKEQKVQPASAPTPAPAKVSTAPAPTVSTQSQPVSNESEYEGVYLKSDFVLESKNKSKLYKVHFRVGSNEWKYDLWDNIADPSTLQGGATYKFIIETKQSGQYKNYILKKFI